MSWNLFNEAHPVARKEHRCEECGITVLPGDKYHRYSGVWDGGEFETVKQCLLCEEAASWFFSAISDAGYWTDECTYSIGDLYSNIVDIAADNKSFAGYRHAVGIKKRHRTTTVHDDQEPPNG